MRKVKQLTSQELDKRLAKFEQYRQKQILKQDAKELEKELAQLFRD